MYFNQFMCGTWLRFIEITNYATFKFCVPYWFICAGYRDFSTNTMTIIKCEDGCALLGGVNGS